MALSKDFKHTLSVEVKLKAATSTATPFKSTGKIEKKTLNKAYDEEQAPAQ